MSIGTTAAAVIAGVGAAGSIGGALISGNAAESAASTQASAADKAAELQYQEFQQNQANQAPWIQSGTVSLSQLMSGLQPGGTLSTPFSGSFTPPTEADAQNMPGYKFTLDQGTQAVERAAAAAGGAFTGGTLKSIDAFTTGLADQTYQQQYANALQTYQTQFNAYNTNQSNLFNRLASVAGLGQTAAGQLGAQGVTAANNQGNYLTQAANASASGTVGLANAINSGITGVTNNLGGYLSLSSLNNQQPVAAPNLFNPMMNSSQFQSGLIPLPAIPDTGGL